MKNLKTADKPYENSSITNTVSVTDITITNKPSISNSVPNTNTHTVSEPKRALEEYLSEIQDISHDTLINAIKSFFWLAGTSGFIAWIVYMSIETKQDLLHTNNHINPSIVIAFLIAVISFFVFILAAYRYMHLRISLYRAPDRSSASSTIKVFFDSIEYKLWKRAYNCLTDEAQNIGALPLPKDDYLQQMMPDLNIHDLGSFKSFFSEIKFEFKPQYSSLKQTAIDSQTVSISLPLLATWEGKQLLTRREQRTELFDCQFHLIKIAEYYFLTNGYFWPKGQKYLGK